MSDRADGAADLSADRVLLSTPTRQAPVAVVFIAARFVRGIGLAQLSVLAVLLATGTVPTAALGLGLVVAVAGLALTVAAWWRFVFHVEGDELVVSKGLLAHERLTIPLDRVQSVSINQGFVNRLIGLVSIAVDTAGGADAEFEIDALQRPRAEALQRLAAERGHQVPTALSGDSDNEDPLPATAQAAAQPAVEEVVVARTPVELARIGLAGWPWAGLAALAPLVAFADEVGQLLPVDIDQEVLIEDNLPQELGRDLAVAALVFVVGALVVGAVFGVLLQMIRVMVTDWDLRLTRTSTGFRRTAGLFSTTSRASALSRVQAVQTDETPMQRALGIRQLTLPTIGQGDLDIPGTTAAELARIRSEVFDGTPRPPLDRRISPRYVFLMVRNAGFVAALATFVAVATVGWWGLVVVAIVPIRWLTARRQWRLRRWGVEPDRIIESYELVNRHTAEIELIKAQTVEVRRSFFERRRGLATVRIVTAEGFLAIPLIPLAEAEAVRDLALFKVESDRRAWM